MGLVCGCLCGSHVYPHRPWHMLCWRWWVYVVFNQVLQAEKDTQLRLANERAVAARIRLVHAHCKWATMLHSERTANQGRVLCHKRQMWVGLEAGAVLQAAACVGHVRFLSRVRDW